jgi:hypothetical protein
VNGHSRKRESATKGVRWEALVFVDAGHAPTSVDDASVADGFLADLDTHWEDRDA